MDDAHYRLFSPRVLPATVRQQFAEAAFIATWLAKFWLTTQLEASILVNRQILNRQERFFYAVDDSTTYCH